MDVRRAVACSVVPLVLAGLLLAVGRVRAPQISASLYDLIGTSAERIPTFLREASASEVSVIVSSPDAEKAKGVARVFGSLPGAGGLELPAGAIEFLRDNRGGLVTREAAGWLETAEGRAKLAKRAQRRLFQSPLPPILGYADDPFGLTDAFLRSLSAGGPKTTEGYPMLTTNGLTRILVRLSVNRGTTENLEDTIAFCRELTERAKSLAAPDVEIRLAGAPVHTAVATATSQAEISLLTLFSLVFIAGLSLVVFRSWKWIPLLASSLAVAALSGGLALVVLFRELHLMTLVMGTTVLGLVIDYSFHWLLSSGMDKPAVRKNLLISFLTTEISLVPLMLATIPVLRQSALFLGVGLAAALGYVFTCYPQGGEMPPTDGWSLSPRVRGGWRLVLGLAAVVLLPGLVNVTAKTELTALYRPPAELQESERQRAAFGIFDLTAIPALADRRAIAENVRRLYAEQGPELARTLQLKTLVPPPDPTDCLVRPQELLAEILGGWTTEALRRLAFAFLALLATLVVLCRRRAVRVLAPSLVALLAVAGVLGWRGEPINVFHVLAAFLLLGMSIDYAVFLQTGGPSAMRSALSSLLTSMAGFGALAFVSFPVVASFGLVLGVGLPLAFIAGLSLSDGAAPRLGETEHGASPLGLELLWIFYRIFGLRALHFAAAAVGVCVWTFSAVVRRASPSVGKTVNFTRSLADKLVVMAEGRDLPRVETDGSVEAKAFLSDVRDGAGVFILSSHCGTIETLVALGDCPARFHAWMDVERTSVFNRFYLHHARRQRVSIHPIAEIGMETAFFAGDALDRGDCLVMAGDRGHGVFRFAHALRHPVYFVACIWISGGYRAIIRRLPSETMSMKQRYDEILRETVAAFPDQHFTWMN